WYVLKFRAGAFKGTGENAVDAVKLIFRYTPDTPIGVTKQFVIDAPLDKPRDFEMRVFLRAGPPDIQKEYRLHWNGSNKILVDNPIISQLEQEYGKKYRFLLSNLKRKNSPQAELDEAKKQIDAFHEYYHQQIMDKVDVASVYNPEIDLKTIPRLWI